VAVPYATRLGRRHISSFALARSLDREHDGAPAEALTALTASFIEQADALGEIEDMLPDAVRLATETGDLSTAHDLAGQAEALAAGLEIPHRQATALYCRGLLDHNASRLLMAAERYGDAGRPLPRAQALEAAADEFARVGDQDQARAAAAGATESYTWLGAAADVARVQARLLIGGDSRPHVSTRYPRPDSNGRPAPSEGAALSCCATGTCGHDGQAGTRRFELL
jgi:hypothetical protein